MTTYILNVCQYACMYTHIYIQMCAYMCMWALVYTHRQMDRQIYTSHIYERVRHTCEFLKIHLAFSTASQCITVHHSASHRSTLHHIVLHCNTLQHTHCITLKHTVAHCTTLKRTATHYNTWLHVGSTPARVRHFAHLYAWNHAHSYMWDDAVVCVLCLIGT